MKTQLLTRRSSKILHSDQKSALVQSAPLWICLLLAFLLRSWLIVHTQGFVDGDEAVVGIQAQHILQGERPIYYYGQPYMGSLEAYLIASLFAIAGTSTWVMRLEPLLLSLLVVWLTWKLAKALANWANLSPSMSIWFSSAATACAAIPPLYDGVLELRAWGGHIETYVLILSLLYATLRLTLRWQAGATTRETIFRWAGIGLLVGLGFWVYPLIVTAVLVSAIWLLAWAVRERLLVRRQKGRDREIATRTIIHRLALASVALPAGLVGFAPAFYWGASHNWANVRYMLSPGNNDSHNILLQQLYPTRLALLRGTVTLYGKCIAPRIIGGALANEHLTYAWLLASFGVGYLLVLTSLIVLSYTRSNPLLVQIRRLCSFPLLFAVGTALVFCLSSISAAGLLVPCTRDEVGRYAAPLMLVLPFCVATIFAGAYQYLSQTLVPARFRRLVPVQGALAALLVGYLAIQSVTYLHTQPDYPFQSFACTFAPIHNEAIIDYMQKKKIHYAWASMWIGNNIILKTQEKIITADPRVITVKAANRFPAFTSAVNQAERPSVLAFADQRDAHPVLLQALDSKQVQYQLARFPAGQGLDVLVITPLNRSLSPFEGNALGSWIYGC